MKATAMTVHKAKMEGLVELKAALEALGTEVATKVGVKANRDAAKVLRDKLKQAAPFLESGSKMAEQYGHLRDNIKVGRRKAYNQGTIVHVVSTGKAFWGMFLEFGTVKMSPKPWYRPVFDDQPARRC
jgi:HK97 gp10 family phage protein